jgi:hypothetical protein
MQRISTVHWFARCGFGAFLLLLACGVATAWFGNGLKLSSTTTRDGTLITFNRFIRESVPDVVIVGSSVSFRLNEEYFATLNLRNLAIAGGSPLTGLEIVANGKRLPKVVLVEANVLSRSTDAALVEKYSRNDRAEPMFFRPIRTAVLAYENWRHAPVNHTQVSLALNQLLKQPPSDFDNHIYVGRARQLLDAEDPTVATRASIKRIKELMLSLDQRGARMLLFELPYSAPIEDTQSVKITREIVHSEFPDPDRWLHIDYTRSELRWADSVHLDERSAVIVSQSIDRALSPLLGQAIGR